MPKCTQRHTHTQWWAGIWFIELKSDQKYVQLRVCDKTSMVLSLSLYQDEAKSTKLSIRTSNDKIACKQKIMMKIHHMKFAAIFHKPQWNSLAMECATRARLYVCERVIVCIQY